MLKNNQGAERLRTRKKLNCYSLLLFTIKIFKSIIQCLIMSKSVKMRDRKSESSSRLVQCYNPMKLQNLNFGLHKFDLNLICEFRVWKFFRRLKNVRRKYKFVRRNLWCTWFFKPLFAPWYIRSIYPQSIKKIGGHFWYPVPSHQTRAPRSWCKSCAGPRREL